MADSVSIPSPTGTTKLIAIIGYPVEQVKAPPALNRLFAERGFDAIMVAMSIAPENLDAAIRGLKSIGNFDGIMVTIPHKFAVRAHADRLSDAVVLGGSANVLRREPDGTWFADNVDGAGFLRGMLNEGRDPKGKAVNLFGAGGAGTAIAAALLQHGVARLDIFDIDAGRVKELVERLAGHFPGRVHAMPDGKRREGDFFINATAVGLKDTDPLPFAVEGLPPHAVVAEVIMKPHETRLLQEAAKRGLEIHHGIHMMTGHLDIDLEFYRVPQVIRA